MRGNQLHGADDGGDGGEGGEGDDGDGGGKLVVNRWEVIICVKPTHSQALPPPLNISTAADERSSNRFGNSTHLGEIPS